MYIYITSLWGKLQWRYEMGTILSGNVHCSCVVLDDTVALSISLHLSFLPKVGLVVVWCVLVSTCTCWYSRPGQRIVTPCLCLDLGLGQFRLFHTLRFLLSYSAFVCSFLCGLSLEVPRPSKRDICIPC